MLKNNVLIVGAGVSGMVLALLLQRQGYQVHLIEKRDYTARLDESEGRSINFTLTQRGLATLQRLNLKKDVLAQAVELQGRTIHTHLQRTRQYKYGSKKDQSLFSIRRKKLIEILYRAIKQQPHIQFWPHCELLTIDKTSHTCHFLNRQTQKTFSLSSDLIIGADGAFSKTRKLMLENYPVNYRQQFFDWQYKELFLTAAEAQLLNLDTHQLHVWPRGNTLLVAIPNPDGSFSMLFSAYDEKMIDVDQNLNQQFVTHYPDLTQIIPSLKQTIINTPVSYLVSIDIDQWVFNKNIVLIGDACHATLPFYGQGMNCALEDAICLADLLENNNNHIEKALHDFEKIRKPNAKALHYLSETHFHELQKSYSSAWSEAKNLLDCGLAKLFPQHWQYEYALVAHTHTPYHQVVTIINRQNKLRKRLGLPLIEIFIAGFIAIKKLFKIHCYRFNQPPYNNASPCDPLAGVKSPGGV